MIRPYDPFKDALPRGTIVVCQSLQTHGLCSRPKVIMGESQATVQVVDAPRQAPDTFEDPSPTKHRKAKKSILYICDSISEAWHMAKGSMEFVQAEKVIDEQQKKEFAARKRNALRVLTGNIS